jgi:hypothetical protein
MKKALIAGIVGLAAIAAYEYSEAQQAKGRLHSIFASECYAERTERLRQERGGYRVDGTDPAWNAINEVCAREADYQVNRN